MKFFNFTTSLFSLTAAALLTVSAGMHVHAQNAPLPAPTEKVVITNGPEVEARRSSLNNMAGFDESGYYIVRRQKKSLFLERLGKNMEITQSVKIVPKVNYQNMKATFSQCRMFNGRLYMFWVASDLRSYSIINLVQEVDTKSLIAIGGLRELNRITFPGRRSMNRALAYGGVSSVVESEDQTKILLTRPEEREEDDAPTSNEKIIAEVFDDQMNKLWEKTIVIPRPRNQFNVQSIRIENDGTLYIRGAEYQERAEARSSRRSGKPDYLYYIYRITDNGGTMKEFPVALEGKFVTDVMATTTLNGDIVLTGFYSERGTYSIKGVFYQRVSGSTEEILASKMTEFDKAFITQYATEREVRRMEKRERRGEQPELFEFDMDNFVLRADGGGTLIAEQYYMYVETVTTPSGNGQTTTRYIYHYIYNDILVLNFSADGTLVWKCKIPKRQHTTNDGGYYSSYALMIQGDRLFFIYNDNPKNLTLQENEAPADFSRNRRELSVVLAEVDAGGNLTRELLLSTERGDVIVRPKVCEQSGPDEMLLYSEKTTVFQFSKVIFKTQ
ncbi:MAG: hypothetical protein MUC87_14605 [Bacteroidia bacterium]|jgi:hypothetical protein|nr:hypothetical protein [Bacteroidia bacterium]